MAREYLMQDFNSSVRQQEYLKLMVNVAKYMGANESTAQTEMYNALQFGKRLAQLTTPREEKRNISNFYNKMSFAAAKQLAPDIPLDALFELVFLEKFKDDEEVIVMVPRYLSGVQSLIRKTDNRYVLLLLADVNL